MADQTTEPPKTRVAPAAYVPFKTFLTAIDSLQHGIPNEIDRTIWRSQSGVVQSQILMAFRFFGLVDEEDHPTLALHRMVDQPGKRTEQVRSLLLHAYRSIVGRDLTKMTPKMLEEAMSDYDVSGDTKRRAISFFLQAARFADVPMHPLLSGRLRGSSGPRRRRSAAKSQASSTASPVTPSDGQSASVKTLELRSGGTVTLSVAMDVFSTSAADREFVFHLIDMLQQYEQKPKANSASAGKEDDYRGKNNNGT